MSQVDSEIRSPEIAIAVMGDTDSKYQRAFFREVEIVFPYNLHVPVQTRTNGFVFLIRIQIIRSIQVPNAGAEPQGALEFFVFLQGSFHMDVPGIDIAVELPVAHIEIGETGAPTQISVLFVHLFPSAEIAAVNHFHAKSVCFHIGHVFTVSNKESWECIHLYALISLGINS